jgi:hypothetical protein
MNFGETVAAAALGASIPGIARWALETYATNRWKRTTPAGQGYARMEDLVREILSSAPDMRALRGKDSP